MNDESEKNKNRMHISPRKVKSNTSCCVSNCHSYARKDSTLSFHIFPKAGSSFVNRVNMFGQVEKIDRRLAWMKKLKISYVGPNERICSLHFCKDDYKLIGILFLS